MTKESAKGKLELKCLDYESVGQKKKKLINESKRETKESAKGKKKMLGGIKICKKNRGKWLFRIT